MHVSVFLSVQWQAISLTVIEKVQIAAAVLGSLFLIASISWLVWSSLSPSAKWQRQDLLFQICYAMYGFMDLVCIGELRSQCVCVLMCEVSYLLYIYIYITMGKPNTTEHQRDMIIDLYKSGHGKSAYKPQEQEHIKIIWNSISQEVGRG